MGATKAFWAHLVLWVGAVVFASLAFTALARCCSNPLMMLGLGQSPHTLRLVERIALSVALAAYPAGLAASRNVLPRGRPSTLMSFWSFVAAPLALGTLLLVGYGIPAAARSDDSSRTPFLQSRPEFYYLHELRDSVHALGVTADREAAALHPKWWTGGNRDLARLANARRSRTAQTGLDLEKYLWFTAAFALLPLVLALIGVCVRSWSGRMSAHVGRLEEWGMAFMLLAGMQLTLGSRAPYLIPHPFLESWDWLARSGADILLIPLLILLVLSWTTAVDRRAVAAWPHPEPAHANEPTAG